jgi:hypothetical protein
MFMAEPANTATTLSIAFSPGQDIRFPTTSSDSIFTFGDYRIERSSESDVLTGTPMNLSFTPFSTLENMGMDNFNPQFYTSIQNNELRPVKTDPNSYTYFGSFYTEVARSINRIIDTFPYAALAFDDFNGVTIYDYSESFNNTTGQKTSTFKIPASVIINEGYILFNSGSTIGNQVSLMTQTNLFEIQLSGATTAETESFSINSYSYFPGVSAYLEFEINGHLSSGAVIPITGTTSTLPVYIRPSRKRMTEYRMSQTRLERQLLDEGLFDIPDIDNSKNSFRYKIIWPRTIDGFNPDTSGSEFEQYKNNILLLAGNVDVDKTDIMIKTMIPDNYINFDTNTQIYQKITASYAKQFDEIKQFIDNIAYAHSINYSGEESLPEKYLVKLSNLLGWKLSSNFSEIDLFEYLANDNNPDQNSFAYYNVELWKRILININWLYKRKGTRDALQFIFKLMGAPECLVVFDEFVYEIQASISSEQDTNSVSNQKSNSRGFINYDASQYVFQEGGVGRGDGQRYINQWTPEFDPFKKVNNIKVQAGDTAYTGSENIVNTKELCATLSPAAAVECDVFDWYKLSGTCWVWGSTAPAFSSLTVPFEYTIPDCEFVSPERITGMTFNEYLEFIYASNIEPRNRKTNAQIHTTWGYPELKRIYMNYYLMADPQSNRLTIKKLEAFLELMEVNFQDYLLQLVPATTILECQGSTYRNTIFHQQRFVYKEGINDGSEFQVSLPPDLRPNQTPVKITPNINDYLSCTLNTVTISTGISQGITNRLTAVKVSAQINQNNIGAGIEAVEIGGEIQPGVSNITIVQ